MKFAFGEEFLIEDMLIEDETRNVDNHHSTTMNLINAKHYTQMMSYFVLDNAKAFTII